MRLFDCLCAKDSSLSVFVTGFLKESRVIDCLTAVAVIAKKPNSLIPVGLVTCASIFDLFPNTVNIWNLLCRILYPGEDLHFLLWVSGDWQEVERNVKRSTESWWNNEKTETWLMDQLASVIFKSFGNCFSWYDPLQLIIGVIFPFGRISARRSLSKRPSDSETVQGSRL